MNNFRKHSFLLLFIALIFIGGCKNEFDVKVYNVDSIIGFVQKGPYINGSEVLISELTNTLTQTGKNFTFQTTDNSGCYRINNIELLSQYIEIKSHGFYFDELTDNISTVPLNLHALVDIVDNTSINVNVLTDIERGRVMYLAKNQLSFSLAKDSAQKAILAIFGLESKELKKTESLNISKEGDENANLLAISIILQNSCRQEDLGTLLARINTDLSDDGILNDDAIKVMLYNSAQGLNLPLIRKNLVKRYSQLGVDFIIPNFEEKIIQYLNIKKPYEIEATVVDAKCYGTNTGSINLSFTGGTAPYGCLWTIDNGTINGKQINSDGNNLVAGIYSVKVIDARGCIVTKRGIKVNEPDPITISVSIKHNSEAQESNGAINVTVSGGVPPYYYLWSTGSSDEDLFNLSSGWYTLKVIDSNQCEKNRNAYISDPIYDVDGNSYPTLQIGSQVWMAENLKVTRYKNGDLIETTNVLPLDIWNDNSNGEIVQKYQWPCGGNETYVSDYGRLYTWYVATDSRGLCPDGWHVPSSGEWGTLMENVGSENDYDYFNRTQFRKLKDPGSKHWIDNNVIYESEYEFNAIPSGFRSYGKGFEGIGYYSYFMATNPTYFTMNWNCIFDGVKESVSINRAGSYKADGLSVRCVKD